MKKLIMLLIIPICLLSLFGCGKKEEKVDFEILDSKINYVNVKGRKIYLATHYTDLINQLKGLDCYVYGGQKSIDEIIENNEIETYRGLEISCFTNEEKNNLTGAVRISMHLYQPSEYQDLDPNGIYWLSFSGDNFDVVTDNGTVLFGDTDREASTLEEALKIFGNDYEIEEDYFSSFVDYNFQDNVGQFSFSYETKSDYIANFYINYINYETNYE